MINWWRSRIEGQELGNINAAFFSERITQGGITIDLEKRLAKVLEVPYVIVTTSGSTALLMALLVHKIGYGDEVIMPDRTWIATAHAVMLAGAKPVLVDVNPDAPIMNVDEIEKVINKNTKAIIPVHLNGRAVDMEPLQELASKHNLLIIEDACQAFCSKYSNKCLGTFGDIGCFSLGMTKLITTGQGGFIAIRDESIYNELQLIRNQGVDNIFSDSWCQFGFNFKFTDLLASFGLAQVENIEKNIENLNEIYLRYERSIKDIPDVEIIPIDIKKGHVPLYIEVRTNNRKALINYLNKKGVQARPVPPSLHESHYLKNNGEFPNSKIFAKESLYLPSGPGQSIDNVDKTITALKKFCDVKQQILDCPLSE